MGFELAAAARTTVDIYRNIIASWRLLIRFAGILFLVAMGSGFLTQAISQTPEQFETPTGLLLILGLVVITVWSSTVFAVRCHRFFLLGESQVNPLDVSLGRPGWLLIQRSLILGLVGGGILFLVAILVLGLLPETMAPVALLVAGYGVLTALLARLGIMLPAAAIGQAVPLKTSWQRTRRFGKPFFSLLVLANLPLVVLNSALNLVVAGIAGVMTQMGLEAPWSMLPAIVVATFEGYLSAAVLVFVLSSNFQALVNAEGSGVPATATP